MTKEKNSIGDLNWYPLYTKSRCEKKAYDNLKKAGYDAYLPLQKKVRQWSDRKKIVESPLISSYVFTRISRDKLNNVIDIFGVSRYISFNGRPAIVRDEELDLLRIALENNTEIEIKNGLVKVGSEINFTSGIFSGYKGKIIKKAGKTKLVVELESIGKTMLVTVDHRNQKT